MSRPWLAPAVSNHEELVAESAPNVADPASEQAMPVPIHYNRNLLAEAERCLVSKPLMHIVIGYTTVECFYAQCRTIIDCYEVQFWADRSAADELNLGTLQQLIRTSYSFFARPVLYCWHQRLPDATAAATAKRQMLLEAVRCGQVDFVRALLPAGETPPSDVLSCVVQNARHQPHIYRYFVAKHEEPLRRHTLTAVANDSVGRARDGLRAYNENTTEIFLQQLKQKASKERQKRQRASPRRCESAHRFGFITTPRR